MTRKSRGIIKFLRVQGSKLSSFFGSGLKISVKIWDPLLKKIYVTILIYKSLIIDRFRE